MFVYRIPLLACQFFAFSLLLTVHPCFPFVCQFWGRGASNFSTRKFRTFEKKNLCQTLFTLDLPL